MMAVCMLVQSLISEYLPLLLLLYWTLAAGSVIVTLLPFPVPQAFKDAVVLSACRGKLWQDKPSALGPFKDWSVPQAWFLHFYVLGSCCNAAVLMMYCLSLSSNTNTLTAATVEPLLLLGLFQLHLIRRALETGLLLRYPPGAAMHGIAYLFGMSYYAVVPLSLLPGSWYKQQQWQQCRSISPTAAVSLALEQLGEVPAELNAVQLMGAAVFVVGNVLQFASHYQLAQLSKDRAGQSGTAAYSIPQGGMFDLVSCPHYLAEIVIYMGLMTASQGQLMPFLMLIWVTVNLVLAAAATHNWYRRHFKDYPPRRRALIPWVI